MNITFFRTQDKSLFAQAIVISIVAFPFIFLYNNLAHIILETYFNIDIQNQIGEHSFIINFIIAVIISPFIETIVFQSLIVSVINVLVRKLPLKLTERGFRFVICIIASIIFSFSHALNHPYYPLIIFPFCFLLNFVFVEKYFQEGKVRAFQLTWLIHMFWNLLILVGFFTSEYIL